MTSLADPGYANVFVVGKNQKNGFSVEMVGDHSRHIDALFNRNGETCRGLYDEVTGGELSRTRENSDRLVYKLLEAGVDRVLETNVICYSTGMSADLSRPSHQGGRERGQEIFRFLLHMIQPLILIAHGASTRKELERVLATALDHATDDTTGTIVKTRVKGSSYDPTVYCMPSLAPPAFNKWSRRADSYMSRLAADVAAELKEKR